VTDARRVGRVGMMKTLKLAVLFTLVLGGARLADARAQFMGDEARTSEGLMSYDHLRLACGWNAKTKIAEGDVVLGWYEPGTDPVEYMAKGSPEWYDELPELRIKLGGTGLVEPVSVGPAGVGRLLVGGRDAKGQGRLLVIGFDAPIPSKKGPLPGMARLQRELDFGVVFGGELASQTPVAMGRRYGEGDHVLVFTRPEGRLYDVNLADDAAKPRLLFTAGAELAGSLTYQTFCTVLTRACGAVYQFEEVFRGCGNISTRIFIDPHLDGNLQTTVRNMGMGGTISQAAREMGLARIPETIRRIEGGAVHASPHFEGAASKSARIENMDWLDAGDGARARVARSQTTSPNLPGQARTLFLDWSHVPGIAPDKAKQLFRLPADVVTWAPVGPGLLAVQTHDLATQVGRLELYRVMRPDAETFAFVEPEHLRTLHAAADYARERIIAVFADRSWPMRAFVLLGDTSTLCRVDLGEAYQDLLPVLTFDQQPALAERVTQVSTAVARGVGPVYWFKRAGLDLWCGVGSAVEFSFADHDNDGRPDGVGFSMATQSEMSKLFEDTGFEGGDVYLEFQGRTVE